MASVLKSLRVWGWAARPKTLAASLAPVLVGTAMAWEAGGVHWPAAGLALLSAILIQVGVNYHNDYTDYLKGADTEERVGPLRVTQAGLVEPETMRRATVAVFGGAVLAGVYLMVRGGWPVIVIGAASLLCAVWYTAGRYSLASLGLADLAVFLFFGPVAVGGTYYVQALACPPEVLVAGVGPGLFSVGILLVNNVRDAHDDQAAGKRTLVVRLGRRAGVALYGVCVFAAVLLPAVLVVWTGHHFWTLGTLLLLPLAARAVHRLVSTTEPRQLNPLLATTGRLLALWALLFSVGWTL
ncbi:MAG: 1,4-dihydroxy-2-naphthoate polyprenyltransferase [Bacteroidetes bacterium SW_9_63_38]|nr:MAG: 1,4-dihydroxy-2-naphthoate polyprenyltransferase [Bacteroidetes bacterium SW_9_63_38]